jgi:hypothetical protein
MWGSQLDPLPLSRIGSRERATKFNFPQFDFVKPSSGFHLVTWEHVRDSISQSGSCLGNVRVHTLTLSNIPGSTWCDSRASSCLNSRASFCLSSRASFWLNSRASLWLQLPSFLLASTPGLPLGPHPCNSLCLGREPKARVATARERAPTPPYPLLSTWAHI